MIENLPIEEEEDKHPTGIAMRIYRSIQGYSMLADPFLVATNKSYFSKLAERTEADILAEKVITPKDIQVTPGTHQHDTLLSGATKELSALFV